MAPQHAVQPWLPDDLPTATNKAYNRKRSDLCNACDNGEWDKLFTILQYAQKKFGQSWANCQDSEGWTPLHTAALEGVDVGIADRLVKMGAWREYPFLPHY
jgi:ankyrin repeat protein